MSPILKNSLKTILIRLSRKKVQKDLSKLSVPFKDIGRNYESLTSKEKLFLSEALGGNYQLRVIKEILS